MVPRDQPIYPRCTPCILASRSGSALPYRVDSPQTNSTRFFLFSHIQRISMMEIRNFAQDSALWQESNPHSLHPSGGSRTIGPRGCREGKKNTNAGVEGNDPTVRYMMYCKRRGDLEGDRAAVVQDPHTIKNILYFLAKHSSEKTQKNT